MKVYTALSQIKGKMPDAVVAIGVFDGVHRGHQKVLRRAVRRARQIKGAAVVMTFAPHPVHVLNPRIFCPLIYSLEHRLQLLDGLGMDVAVVVHFTRRFARLRPEVFFRNYLLRPFHPQEIVIGHDFRFGPAREADACILQKTAERHGIKLHQVSVGTKGRKQISSSRIRRDIVTGDLRHAAHLLGRPFALLGRVVHGDSRGRRIGYRTANLHAHHQLLPPSGVYIVEVKVRNRCYPGLANIGHRPSFKTIGETNIEVHLFDFKQNLYHQEILIRFYKKIRHERVFRSAGELVQQIRRDETRARRWFKR